MKEKNFLDFVAHLTDNCCPWHKSVVAIYATYIEVTFVTSTMVRPSHLGWLDAYVDGGEWFVTSEDDETHVVVRFFENDEVL